ncbi:MAG: polymer-forming cytoskeletal protein [Desulfobacterales bacterium]
MLGKPKKPENDTPFTARKIMEEEKPVPSPSPSPAPPTPPPHGQVEGEVRAQNVGISGQLKGTINAVGKVEVTKEADFFGDIKAKSISVEDGAYFKGSIELSREPHRKSAFAEAAKGPSSSEPTKAAFSQPPAAKKEP